ncbi:MAG TPA: ABC transporter ATP-binding protein [Candidatus Latescibacteria bacterium]|nr:ABC transporter ATP-binding protein [Candidatus Latescibacterota bacterium]
MTTPLLQVRDLHVAFRGDGDELDVDAVRGASLEVSAGETVALVGESGSGKSVTALSILGLLPYPKAHHPDGSIRFQDRELLGAPETSLRSIRGDRVSMIFQEPMNSLNPLHTVERQIAETLRLHRGLDRSAARERVLELLQQVHLPNPERMLSAWPHQLSGGQRQRVMIAMALANEPDLLIADEPTTALDVTVQAHILELLREQQQRLGMSMLLITHDLTIVRHVADRVYVMTQGRIVEQGPTARVFDSPEHAYTQTLLASEPPPRQGSTPPAGNPIMAARGVKVWFPIRRGFLRRTVGHVRAVDGLDVTVRPGHSVGVVGESGSGKTTLGLALLRLQEAEGDLRFDGHDLQALAARELRPLRRHMQIVFQDPFSSLSPRLSAFQIVEEGLRVHGIGADSGRRRDIVAEALREVDLDPDTMDRYPHEFSGGQRQRLAIARAVVLEPRFLVLDEPTSALDRTVQLQILQLLRRLQDERDLAYLFISHDLRVVRALADDLIVMKDGRVVESGPAAQLFKAPETEYTKALMAAAFEVRAAGEQST